MSGDEFFLVGCPRSGTTLLQVMLNRHPSIAIPPETKLMVGFHRMPRWLRRRTLHRINRDLQVDLPPALAGRDVTTPQLFRHLRQRYLERLPRGAHVTHFGEKTPEHTARLDWIADCFPAAPVVALVRDGREVAASLARMPWLHCNHRAAALIWGFYMRQLAAAIQRRSPPLLVVRFEELIADPRRELRRVLGHLGLPVDRGLDEEALITPNPQRDREAFPDRERAWKQRALLPIDPSVLDRGRQGLDNNRCQEVESLIGAELRCWGYDCRETAQVPGESNGGRPMRALFDVGWTACRLPVSVLVGEAIHRWRPGGVQVPP